MQLGHDYLDTSGNLLTQGTFGVDYISFTGRIHLLVCEDIVMERSIAECTDKEGSTETEEETGAEERKEEDVSGAVCQKVWEPTFYCSLNKEVHYYAGHEIRIYEAFDSYGAIVWPAGVALCQYLDANRRTINLEDKAVLELGAGTGLVSIVASLFGAWVTASDLPEVLGNLRSNLCRNTRGRCRYTPQVAVLSWSYDLEQTFPQSVYLYDYVLAADVVYHHDFIDELLETMRHFCQPGTTLIWANKIRFASDLVFTENFKKIFNATLLSDRDGIQIYSATMKEVDVENRFPVMLFTEKAVKQEKESEEGGFGDISKKQDQCPNEAELEELNREAKQRNVSGAGEETENNREVKCKEESHDSERNEQLVIQRSCTTGKTDIYNFIGHEICIENPNGEITCPAAVALCKFLETAAAQEQIVLLDRTVLELYAGTGLLSVVATLLGARVTATDQPERVKNLRSNLYQNTRGHQRHQPQVTALSHDIMRALPQSECHYDYVLAAAEVLYHQDCFTELLVTMRYFCKPSTNLIWAIKVCYPSDLVFIEDFSNAFHTTMLAELDGVRIYLATHRATDKDDETLMKPPSPEEEMEKCRIVWDSTEEENSTKEKTPNSNEYSIDIDKYEGQSDHQKVEDEQEEYTSGNDQEYGRSGNWEESQVHGESESFSTDESDDQSSCPRIWESKFSYFPGKEIHYFMGHKIIIEESFDSYGAMIWPAAIALCKFLETPYGREQINLLDRTVLEIGAGTGLLSIVLTLLGAKLTATDLPEILSNLRYNLNRNTRGLRRHEPQVKELSWGYELEKTFPRALHHYEYVVAADVVYHHNFLDELLDTMHHFCLPGTTLIWANKIRYPSDLTFLENFENIFHVTLLAEVGEIRIYSATYKAS